jgi:hypothetical protein
VWHHWRPCSLSQGIADPILRWFNALPTANNLLLGSNFAQVDQILDRLSRIFDVKDRRAALKDPFA